MQLINHRKAFALLFKIFTKDGKKELLPFFYFPLILVIYAIYYDLTVLKFQPSPIWYIGKAWFLIGPLLLIHLRAIPIKQRPVFLAIHWITYGAFHVYFVSLSYSTVFIETIIVFSIMVVFSRLQYIIFASTMFFASVWAILNARHEMAFVAHEMSAKQDVLINNISLQLLCYLVYYFVTLPKFKIIESEKEFAKLGKSSGFIIHEITKPIQRMTLNPNNVEVELLMINKILSIARSIKNGDESNIVLVEFDLHQLVNESINSYQTYIDEYKIVIKLINKDQKIKTDINLLKYVIDNLIKNSIEAVAGLEKDRFINIHIDSELISITNPYIANDYSNSELFRPMISTKKGHMGVGLYISKSITDNLGYTMSIKTYNNIFEVQVKIA